MCVRRLKREGKTEEQINKLSLPVGNQSPTDSTVAARARNRKKREAETGTSVVPKIRKMMEEEEAAARGETSNTNTQPSTDAQAPPNPAPQSDPNHLQLKRWPVQTRDTLHTSNLPPLQPLTLDITKHRIPHTKVLQVRARRAATLQLLPHPALPPLQPPPCVPPPTQPPRSHTGHTQTHSQPTHTAHTTTATHTTATHHSQRHIPGSPPPAKKQKRDDSSTCPRGSTATADGKQADGKQSDSAKPKSSFGAKRCPCCGTLWDRDINAARCILLCGLWWLAGLRGRPPILERRSEEEKALLDMRRGLTLFTRELNAARRALEAEQKEHPHLGPSELDRNELARVLKGITELRDSGKEGASVVVFAAADSEASTEFKAKHPHLVGLLTRVQDKAHKLADKAEKASLQFCLTQP